MRIKLTKRQRENLGKALLSLMTANAAGFIFNPGKVSLPSIVVGCIFISVMLGLTLLIDR